MHKTPEMMEGTHKRFTLPPTLHLCFDHGVTYDPEWMCPKCEEDICSTHEFPFDIDAIQSSIESGIITLPSGLTHEGRVEFIREKLKKVE